MIKQCFELGVINFKEKEDMLYLDSKKKISIAFSALENKKEIFNHKFKEALTPSTQVTEDHDNEPIPNVYQELARAKDNAVFLTTNADKLFDGYFHEKIYSKATDFDASNIKTGYLYHIHGSIDSLEKEPDQLVFTARQYTNRYTAKKFVEFLWEIFRDYTILFLGYGLNEMEILEYMVIKQGTGEKRPIFFLDGLFEHQRKLCELNTTYYADLSIKYIAYSLDKIGYNNLAFIIKDWVDKLKNSDIYYIQETKEIQTLIQDYKQNREKVLTKFKEDKDLKRQILATIPFTYDAKQWITAIYEEGYLSARKMPQPIPVEEDGKTLFNIPMWDELNALYEVLKRYPGDSVINNITDNVIGGICNSCIEKKEANNYRIADTVLSLIFTKKSVSLTENHINISYLQ